MKITQKISTIRQVAMPFFRAYFGPICLVALMGTIIQVVPNMIGDIFFSDSQFMWSILQAYTILITGPISFAYAIVYLSAFRNQCAGVNSLAYGFQYSNKALVMFVSIYFRTLVASILLLVPGIIVALKYSLSFYVLADNPNKMPRECMAESARLMNGNKFKLFKLILSYIPLMMVSLIPRAILTYVTIKLPLVVTADSMALAVLEAWSSPLGMLLGLLIIIPTANYNVALACFYDIAAEKLVFNEEIHTKECEAVTQ